MGRFDLLEQHVGTMSTLSLRRALCDYDRHFTLTEKPVLERGSIAHLLSAVASLTCSAQLRAELCADDIAQLLRRTKDFRHVKDFRHI